MVTSASAQGDEWSLWEKAFGLVDADGDGKLLPTEVHALFVAHHNLISDSFREGHPAAGQKARAIHPVCADVDPPPPRGPATQPCHAYETTRLRVCTFSAIRCPLRTKQLLALVYA